MAQPQPVSAERTSVAAKSCPLNNLQRHGGDVGRCQQAVEFSLAGVADLPFDHQTGFQEGGGGESSGASLAEPRDQGPGFRLHLEDRQQGGGVDHHLGSFGKNHQARRPVSS